MDRNRSAVFKFTTDPRTPDRVSRPGREEKEASLTTRLSPVYEQLLLAFAR